MTCEKKKHLQVVATAKATATAVNEDLAAEEEDKKATATVETKNVVAAATYTASTAAICKEDEADIQHDDDMDEQKEPDIHGKKYKKPPTQTKTGVIAAIAGVLATCVLGITVFVVLSPPNSVVTMALGNNKKKIGRLKKKKDKRENLAQRNYLILCYQNARPLPPSPNKQKWKKKNG